MSYIVLHRKREEDKTTKSIVSRPCFSALTNEWNFYVTRLLLVASSWQSIVLLLSLLVCSQDLKKKTNKRWWWYWGKKDDIIFSWLPLFLSLVRWFASSFLPFFSSHATRVTDGSSSTLSLSLVLSSRKKLLSFISLCKEIFCPSSRAACIVS